MKLLEDMITAIAVIAGTLVPIKTNSAPVHTNQVINQNQCTLVSENLNNKTNNKVQNYTNISFNNSINLNIKKSGIIATFAPKNSAGEPIELQQLASALGYERFAWVNYVERDPYGIRDRNGHRLKTPYNDPPAGGYRYDAADNHPFYWDIEKCDNCSFRHHYQHPKITNKFQLVFEDHPADPRLKWGESVDFVTHLVGVKTNLLNNNQKKWEILTTFSWKLKNKNIKEGRVSLVKNNIDPSELSPSLLTQIKADGGIITRYSIARKHKLHNHQCLQQNHHSPDPRLFL